MKCTTCLNPRHQDIDAALIGGRSGPQVAAAFGLSPDSVKRHRRNHMTRAPELPETPSDGSDPLGELTAALRLRALAGSDNASREYRLALAAMSQRGQERPAFNVLEDPQWIRLRTKVLDILYNQFPEARMALIHAWEDPR